MSAFLYLAGPVFDDDTPISAVISGDLILEDHIQSLGRTLTFVKAILSPPYIKLLIIFTSTLLFFALNKPQV